MKYAFLVFALFLFGCQSDEPGSLFSKGKSLGVNRESRLEEASGLVASKRNKGMLWVHNDSRNPAELFLMDRSAHVRMIFTLRDATNRDWEDISIGKGPDPSKNYIFIADIGDNYKRFPVKMTYYVEEPGREQPQEIKSCDTLKFNFADGVLDSEALMNDPSTGNIYVVSKEDDRARIYEIKFPFAKDTIVAPQVLELKVNRIVAADISADGTEVLLKNYQQIFYWRKSGDETVIDLLRKEPVELPYEREPQGEAIAWSVDGTGFYTISENGRGERARLLFYKRK